MKELLDKLSSYNLFNYLLPGPIFVAASRPITSHTFRDENIAPDNLLNYLLPGAILVATSRGITSHTFRDENIAIELFLVYFIGMVISRLGSLTIEPAMKKVKFIKFAPYKEFVRASLKDTRIDLLSEQNNTYRTLCAVFPALGILKLYDLAAEGWPRTARTLVLVGLFLLFALAYRKQTEYVRKRIDATPKD